MLDPWAGPVPLSQCARGGDGMPAERVSMRRVREILRLKYEAGASDRAIACSVCSGPGC